MIDPLVLLAFFPAAVALALIPGPEMMLCIGQGARFGAGRALRSALGMALGAFAGAALAGLGLSALLVHAPDAFSLLRWFGAGYLLWLAWCAWQSGDAGPARAAGVPGGLLVALTNPKGAGFSLGVLPQFLDPAHPLLPQALCLSLVMAGCGFCVSALAGAQAARLGMLLTGARWWRGISAGIFGLLALRVITGERG